MNLIETYRHEGSGYNPFLIKENWQVAQLNYMPEQDLLDITKMDRHFLTDEVFILLKGTAILIAGTENNNEFQFECVKMKEGITYNIPVRLWHNIAMDKDAEVIIFEKNKTHLGDFEYRQLSNAQKSQLEKLIIETNNKSDKERMNMSKSVKNVTAKPGSNGAPKKAIPQIYPWSDDNQLFEIFTSELYTSVVGDILDEMECYHQFLPQALHPLRPTDKLIGRSMPVLMIDVYGPQKKPFGKLTEALDQLQTNEIYVASGGEMRCAYWGEILTATAKKRGAKGAIINGYYRDSQKVMEQNWPVFSRGRFGQDSLVRTQVADYRCDIQVGDVWIESGDLIFGDFDGVVVIPKKYEAEVVLKALEKARGEKLVRKEIENGMSSTEAFSKYGIL